MDQVYLDRIENLCVKLESGQYKQAHGSLHRLFADGTDGYCRLGVASAEARLGGVELTESVSSTGGLREEYFDGCASLPPQKVTDYYGWGDRDPMLLAEDGVRYQASILNDHGDNATEVPYTFVRIAAAFRRTFGLPGPSGS